MMEKEFGACPAAIDDTNDGLNSGENSGRICRAVSGTFCGNKVQRTFARKQLSCMDCDFFKIVKDEEIDDFMLLNT